MKGKRYTIRHITSSFICGGSCHSLHYTFGSATRVKGVERRRCMSVHIPALLSTPVARLSDKRNDKPQAEREL